MALTPLSFSIGVKDEASEQLNKINAELNNLVSKLDSIKNIAISLGGDPKEAESLMQSLNGVASSLANIAKLSPEAQAASDRLTASQQKLNEATEMYNGLLAKIKASNPTQTFLDITKGLTGVNASGFAGGFKKLDPTEWAGFFRKFLVQSSDLSAKDVEGNVNQIVANIRRALSESLSNGKPFASILEEGFKFDSVNQKLNEAFAKLREAYIKGMQELKEVEANKNRRNTVGAVIPGLQQQVEAAKKELETLKNAASTTPVNPESFKGAEGAVAELNVTIKTLGEALNKLDFSKINGGLDQLAEKLNKLITELEGVEARMKTAFTGALEANVKSLGDVIDGLAKKMAGMSAPVTEGMKQGEQATNGQTDAAKSLSQVLQDLSQKYKHTAEQAQRLAELASGDKLTKAGVQRELRVGYKQATDIVDTINALNKLTQTEQQQTQSTKDLGQASQQAAEQVQKLAQSAVTEAFSQLAASLNKIKELFDNLAKADGLTQLNNTINGVNTTVEALAKALSNVSNAVKFTGSTEEIAAYEAKVKSLQEQIAALEAKAKGLGETAKVAAEQVQAVSSGGKGGGSKEGLSDAQLKRVNDQLDLLKKRLDTINEPYTQAKELGFKDETIAAKIKYLQDYRAALDEAVKAGSLSGIKVGDYSIFSRAANEEIPSQSQANKMAKQMQEYIAIQQQAQAEADRQAQAQERMRQAAEAAGMSLVKAGEQTQSAGQKTEGAKQQMHGFTEEILVNMRSWEQAGKMMAVLEKRIFEIMAQLQSGNLLKFDTGNLQSDIQELMRFYNIMKEIRNNFGYAQIGDAMLTTSKVLKESGLDFGQTWEKNKQELTAVKTIYEQMMRLQSLANNKNALPTDSLNTKYQRDALQNALRAEEIMAKLKSVDLRQATALVGGQDYQQATAGIEAFFKAYNQNANIAKSQTAELQRLLEKIQGTDKGGGWINVMRSAGVSEDKIKEMRQIAEKIQRAIAALEQSRQMGTAANFVQSDWYRATVIEGKKANDTGYLAVREAHERAAAEREAAKATQESAKAAEKKREEMSKAWREQEAARQKEAAAVEASMQKQMAAEEKARQKSIEDAWKAADQKIKADQHAAQERERAIHQATKEEIKGYEQAVKAEYAKERAMSKRFAAEQEAARKAQQEKDKLYGAAGLRENDPGLQNMTSQLDAFAQRIANVREMVETFQYLISKGIGTAEAPNILREYEQELNTLMRQYESLYQARAALSAQVPFAETQRSVKNVELEQLGEKYRQEAKAADEAAQAKKRDAENSMAAGKAISDLQLKIDKYNKSQTFQKANELKIDTSDYERAIKRLERYKQLLEYIKSDAGKHHNPSLITGIGSSAENDVKKAEIALKQLVTEKQQAATATQQLTAEEQRLAQALNQTTEHARGQSQVLSDLKMMATQYLGVWGGQQFLHNIIEIGGQLEMQRMSIGAILQNQSQANELFDRIKSLATQSPFGVVELDQMTKQLTAYGFKYNELYDMTKRLADISAATGTGVDRLALALGHVRSEAALSGYTLRQFSMGNVPLLQKLSEKLGKTTAEIRKMVRTKEISYEDVESVIKDLTNEGGMFYNMQEVISQSVKARFKNVKDAMAIMYGEMAEGGIGEALKDVADALMELTKNWKDVATVVGTGAVAWGIQRAAVILSTKALGANSAAILSNINSHIRKEGILLSEAAAYRTLSASETQTLLASRAYNAQTLLRIALGKKLTVEQLRQIVSQKQMHVNALALAISTKKLTVEELSHMVAMGKVSKETAIAAIRQAGFKKSVEGASIAMIEQTRVLTFGQKAAMAASTAIKTLGAAFKSFAPMLLITGLVEAFQRVSQMKERAEELGRDIIQTSQDALQSTRNMMGETGIRAEQKLSNGKTVDVTSTFGTELEPEKTVLIKPEFDYETAQGIIDKWTQYIREQSATPNKMLNQALLGENDNVRSLQEQYDRLFDSMQEVIRAQEILSNTNYPLIFEASQSNTSDGWWDDDVVDDASDYVKARKELMQQVTKLSRAYPSETKKIIDAARREDAAFAAATKGMSSYNDMLIKLIENKDEFSKAGEILEDVLYTPHTDSDRATAYLYATKAATQQAVKQAELDNEIDEYIASIKTAFSGVDISPAIQQALLKSFKMALEKMNLPKDTLDKYLKQFADAIGAEMDDAQEKQIKRLADWQKRAGKVFDVNTEIKVKTKTITSIDEFAQAVQKDLKEKQEYIDRNASHIRHTLTINAGIKFNMDKLDTKALNDMIIELGTKVQVLLQQGKTEAAKSLNSVIQDELIPFRDVLASVDENKKWLKSEGYPEKDPTKDKSKNKSGSKKAYKDEEVEKWKERMRNIREAYREYEKWEQKVGDAEALSRIKREFSGLIDENTLNDIKNYRKEIEKIRNDAQARYNSQRKDKSKDYGKQAQQLVRDSEKALNEIDLGVFDRAAEKFKSDMERTLSDLTRKWELFTSVRNATGNTEAASVLAGFGNDIPEAKDVAGAFKEYLQAEIAKMGDEVKIPIRFDKSMSKKEVEDMVKGALGGTKYKEQIGAITDGIQRWIELSKDAEKKAVDAYTAAMTKAMDYVSQVQRINAELAEQNRLIDENNNLSQKQKDRAKGINQANASMKILEASDSYKRFFNNVFGETKTELRGMANTIKAQLNDSLKKGAITAEDYAKKIKDIDNVMQQSEISDPDKWYNKGIFNTETMEQRFQLQRDQGNEKIQQGADMLQKGLNSGDGKLIADGQQMKEAGQNMVNGANKASLAMAIIDKVVHGIDQAVQGTVKAFDYIKEALESLGVDSDAMSTAGDYLHTLGEMSSHVTQSWDNFKSGNFVGASVEAVGAVTSVIKGISQAHDNRLERAIERLREDVKSIEANTELIVRSRERTLGYDMGDVRRQMAQQYTQTQLSGNDGIAALIKALGIARQNKTMYDYYMQNSQGTGYEQEYANLVEQREKYMEILKDQQDKKKKSNDEIEETKAKIAELDDQIAYFTQDLAKELWSIDIKGWADQLSDALASAFENGENMAKAYRDTVTSIIQQMMQKMMQMAILEPMFERLQKQLFGENGKGGVFDPNNPKGSMSKVTKIIGDYFGKGGEGEKAITASMEFMTAFQRGMQNAGLTVLNEASNTLSSGIQGTSEETSDLLAGYVNALRQDVSVNRILLTQYVTQLWPQYIEAYTAQVTSVSSIDNNVRIIMEMMQLGNGAMYEQIAAMRARIDNIVLGIDRVSVR